ncbi:methyltransferase domain-containing protein [Candidatus Woesearchaeota archaeon]|nr:MAG: methyltransferase domain-containing protein [Candidatus Woesearchaeota archaeon]
MKILLRPQKKKYIEDLDKEVTIVKEARYAVEDISKDFHCHEGIISKEDLQKTGVVKSSKGKEFHIFEGSFIDSYLRLKRQAQIIPLKDIGYILSFTGMGKDSVVVEAGAGSGAVGVFLSRFVKKMTAYDINDEHIAVVKDNISRFGLKNYKVYKHDIYKGLRKADENCDVLILDLPDPVKAETACKQVKIGGFIVNYSPMINQAIEFSRMIQKNTDDFYYMKTVAISEDEWEIDTYKARPKSKSKIHSGFLTFARRI